MGNTFEALPAITENQHAALKRLFLEAKQDCHVASFLLAWWHPEQYGGFSLESLPFVGLAVSRDMATVFDLFATGATLSMYFGFEADFAGLQKRWRPGQVEDWTAVRNPVKRRRKTPWYDVKQLADSAAEKCNEPRLRAAANVVPIR